MENKNQAWYMSRKGIVAEAGRLDDEAKGSLRWAAILMSTVAAYAMGLANQALNRQHWFVPTGNLIVDIIGPASIAIPIVVPFGFGLKKYGDFLKTSGRANVLFTSIAAHTLSQTSPKQDV